MESVSKIPSPGESDHGIALDDDQLRKLLQGFKASVLFPIVSVAAFTGARRNEILALRWSDLDPQKKELRIERAVEETKAHGIRFKGPKKESHKRTITIDDDPLVLLLAEREKHLRLVAGVPDGTAVDLSLIPLPVDALMFPRPPACGADLSLAMPRRPRLLTKEFARKARKLGFKRLRFHDLRGTHETAMLDRGTPVHVVAARCGHDPATLLRNYAKRTKKADTNAAKVVSDLAKEILRP
jgi:integrase